MFGQVVIGPPGSGKSTYCYGMFQFLSALGRKCSIVNLDPANEYQVYPNCALDIRDFISCEAIMKESGLGPNGALLHALETLVDDDLLISSMAKLSRSGSYLLFDCPGQVEVFTHQESLYRIFGKLSSEHSARLCVVSLIDSIYLTSASQYISITLLSLRSMLQLGLPQINVISKIDKLAEYNSLEFPLDFYVKVQDLQLLLPKIESELDRRLGGNFMKLTECIADMVEDFGLVTYEVLAVEDKQSMINLLEKIDQTNGYIHGTSEIGGDSVWHDASRVRLHNKEDVTLQERWIDHKAHYDALPQTEMFDHLKEHD